MNAEGLLRPRRNVAIEIIRRVGEGREQQDLSIVRVDRRADLVGDDPFESRQLRVSIRRHKASGGQQRAETITVLGKILPPTNAINVLQQHLDLAANEQRFEGGIIDIDIVDGRFLNGIVMGVDLGEQGLDVSELALDGQRERSDRAFHPLQDIHAQQVNEAFLAVYLAEETLAAANFGAVFLVVSRLLVREYIAKRRIGAEGQAADFVVDLADRSECAGKVHVGLDVHRRQALGELARFCGAVISLHMLSRPGDGQHVEQFEVIEAKHIHEAGWPTFGLAKIKPAVELPLRLADRSFDAGDAMARQRHIVALSNECDLIFEVGQPIVDRRRR